MLLFFIRLADILRNMVTYYSKDSDGLYVVRIA